MRYHGELAPALVPRARDHARLRAGYLISTNPLQDLRPVCCWSEQYRTPVKKPPSMATGMLQIPVAKGADAMCLP
jgi:hypothetical protein